MDILTFGAVLIAALLHASWNAAVKGGKDKALNLTAVIIGHSFLAIAAILFTPWPKIESIPFIILGALIHQAYQIFLLRSYEVGDFTQAYPIARGTAPMMIALIALIIFDETLSLTQLVAILCICGGAISLGFSRNDIHKLDPTLLISAMATGFFIACYSINDGIGARISSSAISFYSFSALLNAALFGVYMNYKHSGILSRMYRDVPMTLFVGGSFSYLAYAIAVWAFTRTSIASVSALRETSVLMAVLIGVFVLKEQITLQKTIAIAVIAAGAILLRLS